MRVLLLPGWLDSGPGHWQTLWEAKHGDRRVTQADWLWPKRGDWMARLEEVLLDSDEHGDYIFLRQGRRAMRLAYCDRLPATYGGKARFNVMNAMAAAGAAFAQGAHLHDIRAGMSGFQTTGDSAPGRLNHIDVNGVHGFVD